MLKAYFIIQILLWTFLLFNYKVDPHQDKTVTAIAVGLMMFLLASAVYFLGVECMK